MNKHYFHFIYRSFQIFVLLSRSRKNFRQISTNQRIKKMIILANQRSASLKFEKRYSEQHGRC